MKPTVLTSSGESVITRGPSWLGTLRPAATARRRRFFPLRRTMTTPAGPAEPPACRGAARLRRPPTGRHCHLRAVPLPVVRRRADIRARCAAPGRPDRVECCRRSCSGPDDGPELLVADLAAHRE